jgi:hypothetical protein
MASRRRSVPAGYPCLRSCAHRRLLRGRRPAGRLGSRRRDGALHRRLRRCRLRHPARPLEARPFAVLGAARADRGRNRARVRADTGRSADLRDRRPCDLRWTDALRLPAAAPDQRHPYCAAARSVDLPRRPQCLPALPLDLRRRRLVTLERDQSPKSQMTRFLHTLALALAAIFVVALFLPDILLVAFVLGVGRTARRGVARTTRRYRV